MLYHRSLGVEGEQTTINTKKVMPIQQQQRPNQPAPNLMQQNHKNFENSSTSSGAHPEILHRFHDKQLGYQQNPLSINTHIYHNLSSLNLKSSHLAHFFQQ